MDSSLNTSYSGLCNGTNPIKTPIPGRLESGNSHNQSGTTGTPTYIMSSQGKFVQRLCRLEEENELLRVELEKLKKWKTGVEAWLIDSFGMGIASTDVKVPDLKEDDAASVCSNDSHDTSLMQDETVSENFKHSINPVKTEEEPQRVAPTRGATQICDSESTENLINSPTKESVLRQCWLMAQPLVDIIDTITISDDDEETPDPNKVTVTSTVVHEKLQTSAFDATTDETTLNTYTVINNDVRNVSSNKANSKPDSAHSSGHSIRKRSSTESHVVDMTEEDEKEGTLVGSVAEDKTPCDVCKGHSPEEQNNMIYCETCNVCVHQACYGIKKIPEGDWNCQPCTAKIDVPDQKCRFCTTAGGAMVRVKSPKMNSWAHVSCVWWIPGVHILNPSKMDIVVGMPKIEKARYKLLCAICKRGKGETCCIQCRYKRCMTAFHVTCAYKQGYRMEMLDDDNAPDGILMLSFCELHRNVDVDSLIKDTYDRRKSTSISPQKKRKRE